MENLDNNNLDNNNNNENNNLINNNQNNSNNNVNSTIQKVDKAKEAEENKKYIFKVAVVACAIVFVLLVGAGILVGLFLFVKSKSDMEKMVINYEIYSEEIYKKKYGDSIVKEMVNNNGADVNETGDNNQSPLFYAVQNNNIKAVEFLIENKADTEIANDSGITPLILAISNNNTKIAELLIKEGKANVYGSYTGNDIVKYPMYYAVAQTNKTMIELLLKNSFDLKREPSLLSYAIANSDESIVRYLIDNGADINYKNADGTTVLYNAVLSLNPALVDYFVSKGAKIEDAGESDMYGNIIMAAAGSKFNNTSSSPVDLVLVQQKSADSAKVMSKIITNINKNTLNRLINGKNALIIAAGNSYIDTVKVLLTNGADVNSADNDGWTSLMYAANNGDIELAKVLIENKANVNAKSYEEKTPLLYAMNSPIESSRNDMINLLIEN